MRYLLILYGLLALVPEVDAGPLARWRARNQPRPTYQSVDIQRSYSGPRGGYTQSYQSTQWNTPAGLHQAAGDGLDEVNAKRAARGLRPFLRDPALTTAAFAAAQYRAARGLFGHVMTGRGDFQFLPPGITAASAGCAAYPAHMGWLSCCTYDNHVYAGAAWVTGRDGKRYMHLFVR